MDLMGYCFDGGLLCGNVSVDKGLVVAFLNNFTGFLSVIIIFDLNFIIVSS